MSSREEFIAGRKQRWDRLDRLLWDGRLDGERWAELASLYRAVCADLSRAQALGLGEDVQRYLDELAGRAHNRLYGAREVGGVRIVELVAREIPREVRASWRWFLAASFLFYGPFLLGLMGSLVDPRFAPTVLSAEQLAQMEEMYASPDLVRSAGEDFAMAGFYVWNNVGIAFRCFATGILAGVGPIFFLVYNGLTIGTVFGHLGSVGSGQNILAFVAGHSAWELTGIVLSGAAGLRMGWALVETGGRTRIGSLRLAAPTLFRLVAGAAVMLFVAAAIEGFWSAGPVPPIGKYAFGIAQIVLVTGWLAFGGRR